MGVPVAIWCDPLKCTLLFNMFVSIIRGGIHGLTSSIGYPPSEFALSSTWISFAISRMLWASCHMPTLSSSTSASSSRHGWVASSRICLNFWTILSWRCAKSGMCQLIGQSWHIPWHIGSVIFHDALVSSGKGTFTTYKKWNSNRQNQEDTHLRRHLTV